MRISFWLYHLFVYISISCKYIFPNLKDIFCDFEKKKIRKYIFFYKIFFFFIKIDANIGNQFNRPKISFSCFGYYVRIFGSINIIYFAIVDSNIEPQIRFTYIFVCVCSLHIFEHHSFLLYFASMFRIAWDSRFNLVGFTR